jgi:DNA-binding NarL/FixJ family response regulator
MSRKLKAVIIDDSPQIIEGIKLLGSKSSMFEITETFTNPKLFLETEPDLKYDICLLDIMMPEIDGLMVAMRISKPIIFITMAEDKLKEALAFAPIDVITKPFTFERLNKAFEKAHKMIIINDDENDYFLFNVLEDHAKMRIRLSDILYVQSDAIDSRNKCIWLKDDFKYTIGNCKFEKLLLLAPKLIQVNRTELISIEAVQSFKYDLINLKGILVNGVPKQITIGDSCRKNFMARMSLR